MMYIFFNVWYWGNRRTIRRPNERICMHISLPVDVVCLYIRLPWSLKINTQASLIALFKYLKPSELT